MLRKKEQIEKHNEDFREELGEEIPDDALTEEKAAESKSVVEDDDDEKWENRQSDIQSDLNGSL